MSMDMFTGGVHRRQKKCPTDSLPPVNGPRSPPDVEEALVGLVTSGTQAVVLDVLYTGSHDCSRDESRSSIASITPGWRG